MMFGSAAANMLNRIVDIKRPRMRTRKAAFLFDMSPLSVDRVTRSRLRDVHVFKCVRSINVFLELCSICFYEWCSFLCKFCLGFIVALVVFGELKSVCVFLGDGWVLFFVD